MLIVRSIRHLDCLFAQVPERRHRRLRRLLIPGGAVCAALPHANAVCVAETHRHRRKGRATLGGPLEEHTRVAAVRFEACVVVHVAQRVGGVEEGQHGRRIRLTALLGRSQPVEPPREVALGRALLPEDVCARQGGGTRAVSASGAELHGQLFVCWWVGRIHITPRAAMARVSPRSASSTIRPVAPSILSVHSNCCSPAAFRASTRQPSRPSASSTRSASWSGPRGSSSREKVISGSRRVEANGCGAADNRAELVASWRSNAATGRVDCGAIEPRREIYLARNDEDNDSRLVKPRCAWCVVVFVDASEGAHPRRAPEA